MVSIVITLTIAAVIGYTAQVTGLCMVRGVSDWTRGRRFRWVLPDLNVSAMLASQMGGQHGNDGGGRGRKKNRD